MRAVIQRVKEASVSIEGKLKSSIDQGLLVLLGVEITDDETDAEWVSQKIAQLRIFEDEQGKMNRSLKDVDGNMLIISQFTLFAQTKKGNRPSFIRAASPEKAIPLYENVIAKLEETIGKTIGKGTFGANMQVALLNDGPVTLILDSKIKE
jgi:D-aminoacyl-tRNA deacylase